MKLSKAGIKPIRIKKEELDETYPAQDILLKSGQVVQYGSGIYALNNIPKKLKGNIESVIKRGLESHDAIETEFPVVQPDSIWEASGRLDQYLESRSMLTMETKRGRCVLAPTAEEAAVCFAKEQLDSYKRLPATFYQIGDKYRDELRTRGYLLRAKSFLMMDAYSFDADAEKMKESYENMRKSYLKIFEEMGLPVIPVAADSGTMGGKKSEEFMVLSDIGEDTILVEEGTNKGFNKEVLERPDCEEYLRQEYGIEDISHLKEKKAMELGHIFQLGTKYSIPMEANFIDDEQQQQPYYMGCYGIGVSRTLGLVYERSLTRDERGNIGITLPVNLAPYLIQIVAKGERQMRRAEALYEVLQQHEAEAILDDRTEGSLGSRIKDAKLLGTPYVAILGDRTKEDEVEVENAKTGKKQVVKIGRLLKGIKHLDSDRRTNPNATLEDYISGREERVVGTISKEELEER